LLYDAVMTSILGCTAGEFDIKGNPSNWQSIVVRKGKASLAFSVLYFTEAQDEFCKKVLYLAILARNAEVLLRNSETGRTHHRRARNDYRGRGNSATRQHSPG
jgi:hypothetical protein